MAVVIEANDWLCGWHAMANTMTSIKNDARAFRTLIQQQGASDKIGLYGVTHSTRNPKRLVIDEMRMIASEIGYTGKVRVYCMKPKRERHNDFMLFSRRGGGDKCAVSYIDQTQVTHKHENVIPSKTAHRQIFGGQIRQLTTSRQNERNEIVESTTSPIVTAFDIGNNTMSMIGNREWTSFVV